MDRTYCQFKYLSNEPTIFKPEVRIGSRICFIEEIPFLVGGLGSKIILDIMIF